MAKQFGQVTTDAATTDELRAAIVFDPRIGQVMKPNLGALPRWGPRVAGARVQVSDHQEAVVWVVHGFVQPAAADLRELSEVVELLICQARSFGNVPIVLGGDFNAVWSECASLVMLSRDGWVDGGVAVTCIGANSVEGRRIDLTVMNRAYQALASEHVVRWDTGLPTHAFRSGERRQEGFREFGPTR